MAKEGAADPRLRLTEAEAVEPHVALGRPEPASPRPEPAEVEAADPRLRFIWEESLRGVERQIRSLDEVRNRTGVLVMAGSISTAFLASAVLANGGQFRLLTWIGFLAFVVLGLLAAWILRPQSEWKFHRKASELIDDHLRGANQSSMDEIYGGLARQLESDYAHNALKLDRLYRFLEISCIALVVEMAAFLLDLRGRR